MHCGNGARDGDESDTDCGGSCNPCDLGARCDEATDCASRVCDQGDHCAKCDSDAACDMAAGYRCQNGACVLAAENGAACKQGSACRSGHCPAQDGVCCDKACDQTCEACVATKTGAADGTCALVDPSIQIDPDGECSKSEASSCGPNGGGCDGTSTACKLWPMGTECGVAVCTGGDLTAAPECDGTGTCKPMSKTSCSPYMCHDNAPACRTSCSTQSHCVATYYCSVQGGPCKGKKTKGLSCMFNYVCISNTCVSGICE